MSNAGLRSTGRRQSWPPTLRCYAMAVAMAVIGWSLARASDVQELFPENDVSRQPFVEFRARGLTGLNHPGHVWVALGTEGDNGARTYMVFAGFYPQKQSGVDKLGEIWPGVDGHLGYDFEDLHDDVYFRVRITSDEAYTVRNIIEQWDTRKYVLPSQNCVTLVTDVARALNLKVPDTLDKLGDPFLLWPVPFVRYLAEKNSTDQTASVTADANTERDRQWQKMAQIAQREAADRADFERRKALLRGRTTLSAPAPLPLLSQPNFDMYFNNLQ